MCVSVKRKTELTLAVVQWDWHWDANLIPLLGCTICLRAAQEKKKGRLFPLVGVWCPPGQTSSSLSNDWLHIAILEFSFGYCSPYFIRTEHPSSQPPCESYSNFQLQVVFFFFFFEWRKQKKTYLTNEIYIVYLILVL